MVKSKIMKTTLKNIVWLAAGAAILYTGFVFYKKKKGDPKIDIDSVDWENKTVTYDMSYGSIQQEGTISLGESKNTGGAYDTLRAVSKGQTMVFTITKNQSLIMIKTVDFKNQRIV